MSINHEQFDDDGRVIVNMDVEGMPRHDKQVRLEKTRARKYSQGPQGTKPENRLYTWYSMLYGLLIAAVFSITWILFTLFCTQIWFR
jgi:hypothetical protein